MLAKTVADTLEIKCLEEMVDVLKPLAVKALKAIQDDKNGPLVIASKDVDVFVMTYDRFVAAHESLEILTEAGFATTKIWVAKVIFECLIEKLVSVTTPPTKVGGFYET